MNERDFADLAVGHAMNALSEADERAYQEALAGNPHWDHHVRDASDIVTAISASVEPVEPPPSVREALFARISDLPQDPAPLSVSAGAQAMLDDEDFAAAGAAPSPPNARRSRSVRRRHPDGDRVGGSPSLPLSPPSSCSDSAR